MSQHLYSTSLDGMRTIQTNEPIEENSYVYIYDKIYEDDMTLFKSGKKQVKKFFPKNKSSDDELETLDLKQVKIAEIKMLTEEEMTQYKNNQMYTFLNFTFTSTNRLNKNQVLEIDGKFYTVQDIIKHKDKPLELVLDEINYIQATNMYTILQSSKDKNDIVFGRYPSYGEALSNLAKLRGSRDGNFYRFP